jgi:D-alanyl-D-alanine carboxypeptidase
MMNRKAKLLGMSRTQFVNSSGLHSNNQVTTARDMARLGLALTRDYAEYAPLFRAREITVQGKTFTTHNALLENYPGADGLKTGFICNAGFNIVATAKRSGKQVLVVTLGNVTEKARTAKATSLLNMGFDKGWGFGAPSLESLDAQGASNRPLNMRQAVCRKDKLAPTQGPVPSLFAASAPESASIDSTPAQSVDTDFAPLPPRRPMLLR